MKTSCKSVVMLMISVGITALLLTPKAMAQQKDRMVRIARITVDPTQLAKYNAALKEQMTAAVHSEPGVLTYYAVADKTNPAQITILEVYADSDAYKLHIQTPHFKKYKEAVKGMVKSLELEDVNVIGIAKKSDM
ncbi:MAG: putative quinol monooxygenase [Mucilaginibacter sp.]